MSKKLSQRPLSPHLQIYKPQITSVLSIIHRVTGIGLSIGIFFLLYWLGAIATSAQAYGEVLIFFKGYFGQVILGFCLLGFYYHLVNGIRHLAWDIGYGFSLKVVTITGWLAVVSAVVMTLMTWIGIGVK